MSNVTNLRDEIEGLADSSVVGALTKIASRPNDRVTALTVYRLVKALESISQEQWEMLRDSIDRKRKHAQQLGNGR